LYLKNIMLFLKLDWNYNRFFFLCQGFLKKISKFYKNIFF